MADNLLQTKIKEALIATGHDRQDAHKLLLTWAVRDPALLLTLTKPHLKAIASGAVDHYMRSHSADGEATKPRTAIDDVVASAAVHLPMDQRKSSLPPPQTTARQASAMRKLADAFSEKDKKK